MRAFSPPTHCSMFPAQYCEYLLAGGATALTTVWADEVAVVCAAQAFGVRIHLVSSVSAINDQNGVAELHGTEDGLFVYIGNVSGLHFGWFSLMSCPAALVPMCADIY